MIEYDPEDVELFIQVADAVEAAFPGVIVEGNEDGDGRPGSFEVVSSDGAAVFSRLASGKRQVDPEDIVARISMRSRLPRAESKEATCG